MTVEEIEAEFERLDDEFLKFADVEPKRSQRRDLHAFIRLDELLPEGHKIVAAAEHDQIWIGVELEELAPLATPELVLELARCGVFIDEETESLSMFA